MGNLGGSCCLRATHLACPAPPGTAESKDGRDIQLPASKQVHTEFGSPCAFSELILLLELFNPSDTRTVQHTRKKAGEERGATWAGWLYKSEKRRKRRRKRLQPMLSKKWGAAKERESQPTNPHPIPTTSSCGVRGLQTKKRERCLQWSQGVLS